MNSRTAVKSLLTLVLGLPVIQAVLWWVGGLLGAMGDEATESVLKIVGTTLGIVWLASLVGLIVALALQSLEDHHGPRE